VHQRKEVEQQTKPRQNTKYVEEGLADPNQVLKQNPPKKRQQTREQNGPKRNLFLEIVQEKKNPNHPQRRNKSHTIRNNKRSNYLISKN